MSQRHVAIAMFGIVLLGIAALVLAGGRRAETVVLDDPTLVNIAGADVANQRLVALGREIYATYCASCHGLNLEGQFGWQNELPGGGRLAPPLNGGGQAWQRSDQLLFAITSNGGQPYSPPGYRNNMPGFANSLNDTQIWAVLAYMKSSWPPELRAAQEQAR